MSCRSSSVGGPAAAVARVLARPEQLPAPAGRRRQQRLGRGVEVQVAAEVDEQEPIVPAVAEVAEHERLGAEHGAVDPARPLGRKTGSSRRSRSRSRCKRRCLGVALPLGRVELRPLERLRVGRTMAAVLHLGMRQAAELREEVAAAPVHQLGQLRLVVAEVEERARRGELLPLEEHRRARRQQQQRRQRPVAAGVGQPVEPVASRRVGDLVVVLEEDDEAGGFEAGRRLRPALALPGVPLPLIEVAPLGGRR